MKNEIYKHLKFKIGEESCKYEFRLFQEEDYCCKKYCYDVYLFDKAKDENLFGLKVNKIMLYYNADVLTKIDYYFNPKLYTQLKVWISQFLGSPYREIKDNNIHSLSWYIGNHYMILKVLSYEKVMVLCHQKRKNI